MLNAISGLEQIKKFHFLLLHNLKSKSRDKIRPGIFTAFCYAVAFLVLNTTIPFILLAVAALSWVHQKFKHVSLEERWKIDGTGNRQPSSRSPRDDTSGSRAIVVRIERWNDEEVEVRWHSLFAVLRIDTPEHPGIRSHSGSER